MPVRFILGRAGRGKTRHCFQEIARLLKEAPLGPPIYWLLPRQATFQAERELTCQLGGFTRVRVVSFDYLGQDILKFCGQVEIPEVTAVGRRMVVGHLLRKHQADLKFYSASALRPGLAAELDSTFGEFERAGLTASDLDDLLHRMEPADDGASNLRDKLHDVALLLGAYNAYIGQDRLDPHRRLQLTLQRVAGCSFLKETVFFVDDFFEFTEYERQLLASIAAICPRTEITLLIDPQSPVIANPHLLPEDLSLFHRTESTYRALHVALTKAGAKIQSPLILRETRRFHSLAIGELERQIFLDLPRSSPAVPAAGIELLDAPDARDEVDAVARRIRLALRDGLRLRDIAVLARDINSYQELIDASFGEHSLPYFADRRRSASHHPMLQMIRSALLIALHGWPHDAVMTFLKTGLSGVTEQEADELENYVLRHRIRGRFWESSAPWGFRRELTAGDPDDLIPVGLTQTSVIDDARQRLLEKLAGFIKALPPAKPLAIGEILRQVLALLERFEVRKTLSRWMTDAEIAGDLEQRGEHEQVWTELMSLFEKTVDLLGSETVTLADFVEMLDNGLESFDLALTPPTVDQILVGQIDRSRIPNVKMVIVLGLNEGQFPRTQREDCVLSDYERRLLRKRKIDLDPETERQLLNERLLAYIAFTRASNRLVLTRHLADDSGRPCHPSPFWNELIRLFPQTQIRHAQRASQSDPATIDTPRQLVTALMRWVRSGGKLTGDSPWPALYQWLATSGAAGDPIHTMRNRAWKALAYTNPAGLSAETAAKLFPAPLQATVAQLETFAACPFKHFVRFGLKLQERQEPDVTALDLSNAYHRILQELITGILATRQDWCELDAAATRELVRFHAAEVGRTLRGELMLSSARNRYILDRIERTLIDAIEAQREMHRRGKYRPRFAALKFGGEKADLPAHPLDTPAGNRADLRGQIDRVDLNEKGGAFTVSDYKLAAGALALDRVYHGLSLQLLVNLLVVQSAGQQLVGRKLTPAAAFFLQLLRSPQLVEHPSEAKSKDDPNFHLRIKPRGIIDARARESLDRATTEGNSPVVAFYLKKDGQLGNRHITDVADEPQFAALLTHVERRLGELADQILAGGIGITPYWLNRETPCPRCEYRGVCRFEPGINKYNSLSAMKREEVLKTVTGGGEDAG